MELESAEHAVRRLRRQVRRGRRHRRGADHRRPSCAARASSCASCPAARSSCSRRTTSCSAARAGRATWAACSRPRRSTPGRSPEHAETIGHRLAREGALGRFAVDFVVVRERGRRVDAVRDRAQPAQGRDHPPVPHPAVPHRRPLRPGDGAVPHPARPREAPGRHRPPRVRAAPRADAGRPVRHRGPARPALRPVAPGRHRVPHDQLPDRARPDRADGRRRHRRRRTARYREAERILLEEARGSVEERPLPV